MALYDESVREWSYMIVIAWCYDYDCLIFIKCSYGKNITSDYGYHMVLYDEIVREWSYMIVIGSMIRIGWYL